MIRDVLRRLEEAKAPGRLETRATLVKALGKDATVEITGTGANMEVEIGPPEGMDKLDWREAYENIWDRALEALPGDWHGYRTGYGSIVLQPGKAPQDFEGPAARRHY